MSPPIAAVSSGPLISAEALHQLLSRGGEPVTLLDVRWQLGAPPGREQYAAGHIPGAVFIDLDTELAAPPGAGGRHPLPDGEQLQTSMRAAGVSSDRRVVVYDDAASMAAARAWWVLRYFGHSRVAVLDGGLAAWVAAGLAVETVIPAVEAGDFVAVAGGMPVLDADAAAELARSGILLDARAPERFAGQSEPIDPVAGHIPGARNRPTSGNVDGRGRFLPRHALREAFEQLDVSDDVAVGAYCGSGVTAAHELLALELAGFRGALYAGSWSEWIVDPRRPVARKV